MNSRAFNLFTALVSFVLIMLTILLINSMTETESGTVTTINDISAQSQMQTAADLARADAIQVFNYGLRFRIEDWLTREENGRATNWYTLQADKKWSDIVQDYGCVNFGGCRSAGTGNSGAQFADMASKTIVGILDVGQTFGRYEIDLENDESSLSEDLRQALVETIEKSVEEKQFFEIIECDMPETNFTAEQIRNCLGTFYVKLKLGDVSDETYEKFPKIVVKNSATGDYLKQGILPQADLRIYVPLRIFKAIAQSKYYGDNKVFNKSDFYKSMMLGMCDPNSCEPRKSVFNRGGSGIPDAPCPGSNPSVVNDSKKGRIKNWPADYEGSVKYDADDPASIKDALQRLVGKQLCTDAAPAGLIDVDNADGLNLVTGESACNIYSSSIVVESIPAKTIRFGGDTYNTEEFEGTAYCTKAAEIRATIRFEETNPNYKVNKNNKNVYTIELLGSYSSVNPNPDAPENICYTKCITGTLVGCEAFRCEPTP